MSNFGNCGDNVVVVEGGYGNPVRIKLTPKTTGKMGGEDLVISESRGDTGVREIVISPRPKPEPATDGVTVT